MFSMTGFARRIRPLDDDRSLEVSIRSVNHRFLELFLSLPEEAAHLENVVRADVTSRLRRGKVHLSVKLSGASATAGTRLNRIFLESLAEDWSEVFPGDPLPGAAIALDDALLRLPSELSRETSGTIQSTVREVVEDLVRVRKEEAGRLLPQLRANLDQVREIISGIEARVPELNEKLLVEYRNRVEELLGRADLDEGLLATEAGTLTMKMNIEEEIVRADRFLSSMDEILDSSDGPVGKKLNFYCQELHRELNTMGQKIRDGEMREEILRAKVAAESFREQIQNVE